MRPPLPVHRLRSWLFVEGASEPAVSDVSFQLRPGQSLALVGETSISCIRVVREFDRIVERRGRRCMVVSDNGTEFTSDAILSGQRTTAFSGNYIEPGRPT